VSASADEPQVAKAMAASARFSVRFMVCDQVTFF
jgi:hypothetical protein